MPKVFQRRVPLVVQLAVAVVLITLGSVCSVHACDPDAAPGSGHVVMVWVPGYGWAALVITIGHQPAIMVRTGSGSSAG